MKKVYQLCLVVFYMLLNQNLYAQRQMNYWALPPYKINFTGASPTSSTFKDVIAQFNGLTDVAFDASGNLIVAGYADHSIRKVTPDGFVTTIAGTGTAGFYNGYTPTSSMFNAPAGVVLDAAQNIYMVDNGNNCIRKITPAGVVTTFAGNGTAGTLDGTGTAARFNGPFGITIDGSGNLYVADGNNNSIRKITPAGVVSTFAGSTSGTSGTTNATGTAARFYQPRDVVADASGNIYVTDNYNHMIRKITSAGVVSTIAGTAGSVGLVNGTGAAARFDYPWGITIDASSNLYVSDATRGVIRKITSAGVVSTYAGTGVAGFADGSATSAKFQWPTGVTLDATGNLYVADNETHRVRKVSTTGIVSTVAGNGTAGFVDTPPASTPYKVSNGAFDENGNVLFYIKNNSIVNASGATVGNLADYTESSTGYSYYALGNEISIVPVPGSCRDFYVIYSKFGFSSWYEGCKLLYSKLSVSSTGVVSISSNGNLICSVGGDFLTLAVGKLTAGTRNLYAASFYNLWKCTISATGITSATNVKTLSATRAQILELSSDGSKLALVQNYGTVTGTSMIQIYNTLNFDVSNKTIPSMCSFYGLEFSPDDNFIYFTATVCGSSPVENGIYKIPATTTSATVTPVQITNGHYANTELELARDGYIYAVDQGSLGRLNPATDVVTSAGLNIVIASNSSTSYPMGNFYTLPDQIDGENYDYFFGTAKLSSVFKINTSTVSATTAVNTFTCGSILLNNTAGNATSYQITINKADAAGNVIAGYSYTTGLIGSAPAPSIDIKALNLDYLASISGYFKIQFYTQNACTSQTSVGLIYNSTMSLASANFTLNAGGGSATPPSVVLPGTTVSAYGASLNGSNSTGIVDTYQIKVDQVDCTTGVVLTANIVNTPATAVTNGDPSTITGVSFNSKSSPLGYFVSHAGCFKITYTVTNACGSSTQTGYFNSDPAVFRLAGITTTTYNTTGIYPNPSNGITNVAFSLNEDKVVQCKLNNLQGGTSYVVFENQSASQGNNEVSFDTSILPAGLYIYELNDGSNTFQTGKLVITK